MQVGKLEIVKALVTDKFLPQELYIVEEHSLNKDEDDLPVSLLSSRLLGGIV